VSNRLSCNQAAFHRMSILVESSPPHWQARQAGSGTWPREQVRIGGYATECVRISDEGEERSRFSAVVGRLLRRKGWTRGLPRSEGQESTPDRKCLSYVKRPIDSRAWPGSMCCPRRAGALGRARLCRCFLCGRSVLCDGRKGAVIRWIPERDSLEELCGGASGLAVCCTSSC
jgi:hypothetical protein